MIIMKMEMVIKFILNIEKSTKSIKIYDIKLISSLLR
jgi:hypothetical protein